MRLLALTVVLILVSVEALVDGAFLTRWLQAAVLAVALLVGVAIARGPRRAGPLPWLACIAFTFAWADLARFQVAAWTNAHFAALVTLSSFLLLYGFALELPRRLLMTALRWMGAALVILGAAWLSGRFLTSPHWSHSIGRTALLVIAAGLLATPGDRGWARSLACAFLALGELAGSALSLPFDALAGVALIRSEPKSLRTRTLAACTLLLAAGAWEAWVAPNAIISLVEFLLRVVLLGIPLGRRLRGAETPGPTRPRGARGARLQPG